VSGLRRGYIKREIEIRASVLDQLKSSYNAAFWHYGRDALAPIETKGV